MASPSNANEPELPDEELDEEEIIPEGFDMLVFWDQYRQVILMVAGVVLLAGVVFGIYEFNQAKTIAASANALATASSEEDFRALMDKYPGSTAAGNAALLLGAKLRDAQKFDEANSVLQAFVDKYPTHPLASAGDLSIAETLEAQGKADDALARYQEVAAKYPDSFSAPVAVISQANILKKQGKIDEAKRLYENFVAQFPDSVFTKEAEGEMHLLRAPAGAAVAQDASVPATGPEADKAAIMEMLKSAVAASPTAAPKASAPAPVMPVAPGASPH